MKLTKNLWLECTFPNQKNPKRIIGWTDQKPKHYDGDLIKGDILSELDFYIHDEEELIIVFHKVNNSNINLDFTVEEIIKFINNGTLIGE